MPTLPNMGLDIPTLGGDSGTWDDKLNAALEAIDSHDHTAGAGTAVPSDGIDIDEDLPVNGHGLTSIGRLKFSSIAAPSDAIALFVNSADNELYWRTFGGVSVKLTNGTTINTSLVGGIAGDYSTVGAEVAYDDSADRYTFKQQGSPKPWARLAAGDVRIYENGTTENVFVGLKAPAALAASYDITWPLAVPASTSIMLMSSAGDVTVTNTIPNAITFSSGITASTLATTGAATIGTTLTSTGLITATAGLTAAANQHVTVSGTGKYKRGDRTISFPVIIGEVSVSSGSVSQTGGTPGTAWAVSTVGYIPLPMFDLEGHNATITEIRIYNTMTGTGNVTVEPFVVDIGTGAFVSFAASSAIAVASPLVYSTALSSPTAGRTLWVRVTTAGTNSGTIFTVAVTASVP